MTRHGVVVYQLNRLAGRRQPRLSPSRPLDRTAYRRADRAGPEPLPEISAARQAATRGIAPPPTSPASILKLEVQPIDLTTALNLAGVQNPDLNIARTRILEAAAAAAARGRLFLAIHQSRHEL